MEILLSSEFTVVTCATCGMIFAMPKKYADRRKEDHKEFSCPSGHNIYFASRTEKEILAAKLKYCRERRDRAEARYERERRSRIALKGVVTKMKAKAAE